MYFPTSATVIEFLILAIVDKEDFMVTLLVTPLKKWLTSKN